MNTTQLRCFISVAEYLSFARVSEQLNMTQPAISHQIAALEKELDTKLFIRTTRSVKLTDEGRIFLPEAKKIIRIAYSAKNVIHNHAQESQNLFNIGIHTELELTLTEKSLAHLKQIFPQVRPNIKILPAKSLRNSLDTEDIHVMFSYRIEEGIKEPGYYTELCKCPLACVMPYGHPLSGKTALSFNELQNEDIILYETHKNPPAISRLQNQFVEIHPPGKLTYTDTPSCALALLYSGFGITLLPDIPPLRHPDLAYIPLKDSEMVSYGVYYKTLKERSILKHFIEITKNQFN